MERTKEDTLAYIAERSKADNFDYLAFAYAAANNHLSSYGFGFTALNDLVWDYLQLIYRHWEEISEDRIDQTISFFNTLKCMFDEGEKR